MNKVVLSFAAPLLILLGLLGLVQRKSNERIECIPAICVGSLLIVSSTISSIKERKNLWKQILDGKVQSKKRK